MSDVNKLDNKQCPFDPEQYKYNKKIDVEVDNVAPTGSLPWALIQVYVGKFVRRNGWDAQVEYIKLLPGSSDNNVLPQIGIIDKEGTTSWQPTQEDLMACDWVLLSKVTPVECMLSFDLTIGTAKATLPGSEGHKAWGYVKAGYEWDEHEWSKYFGDLKVIQNKTGIVETSSFYWHTSNDDSDDVILWVANSDTNQESFQKLITFFQTKELYIIIDGVTYNLGKSLNLTTNSKYEYEIDNVYKNDDAKKLGTLLQENAGNTLHFCINWK